MPRYIASWRQGCSSIRIFPRTKRERHSRAPGLEALTMSAAVIALVSFLWDTVPRPVSAEAGLQLLCDTTTNGRVGEKVDNFSV
jgi:hypothetical protein